MPYIREHELLLAAGRVGHLRLEIGRQLPTADISPTMSGLYAVTPNHPIGNWGARNIVTECRDLCHRVEAHDDGAEIFHAFLATCHDHFWSHRKLVTLFEYVAQKKLSQLIALALGVNTHLISGQAVVGFVSRDVAQAPDLGRLLQKLDYGVAGFAALRRLATADPLYNDVATAARIDTREAYKQRPFAPTAVLPPPVYRRHPMRLRCGD